MANKSASINEAFAARRAALISERQDYYENYSEPDFAPFSGICHSCKYDLVANYGNLYPTATITDCPSCGSSFTD